MSPVARRRLRLARRGLWYALAIGLVLMALGSALFSQLLPLAERHPDLIARWLGERAGRDVAFARVETDWTRRGPLLRLEGLRLGEGDQAIAIGDAEVLVSQYAGLLPGRSFTELRLRGLDLTVERQPDGTWQVRGLPGQAQSGGDPFAALEGLGELQVVGGRLRVLAPALDIDARVPRVDLRLRVDGDRVRAGLRARMDSAGAPLAGGPLSGTFELDRGSGDGRGHVRAEGLDLTAWSPLFRFAGVATEAGRGRGQAWVLLRGHRVERAIVDADAHDVALRGAVLDGTTRPRLRFERVQARARWQREGGDWRIDAPVLRFGSDQDAQVLDGLALAGGSRTAFAADHLDAGPLFAIAALSDRVQPDMRRWLLAARPQASLDDVEFGLAPGGALRASATVRDAGYAPVGDAPGFHGLAGRLLGDGNALSLQLDPRARFRFEWPSGFGVPHEASLAGTINGWREGEGWRVGTDALRVRGDDFGLDVRGGMWFQGDGTRPWIDLAAHVQPTAVTTARGFWLHHLMPPATVHWLDQALQGGRLEGARAVVSGDLDDWPFRDDQHAGRFQVDARIADATLAFAPDWPAAEHVDADVSFVADGFHLDGKGVLAGVGIRSLDAGIGSFGHAVLEVAAQGGGDAARLLSLLRASPLHASHGDTLDNLRASGLASVTFGMELPLHAKAPPADITGTVTLAGAKLADRRWDLAFEDVRGRATYGSGGFRAERLAVRHDGEPGTLSLRAGDDTRDRGQAFEAELRANLAAADLLRRVDALDWLRPHVSGRSDWSARLSIPRAGNGTGTARLQLQSDLAGTALALPAPLDKVAGIGLPARIETALPVEAGEVTVALGSRMAVRARSGGATGVRVVLGSDTVAQAPPASGLVVAGRTGTLDALGWIGIARAATASPARAASAQPSPTAAPSAPAFPLRGIDVHASRLQLLGASFADTRLQLEPAAGALLARVEGAGIAGEIRVPDATGATVSGRFQRVHWPLSPPGTAVAAGGDDATLDPASLPPFAVDIDALKVGDAALGSAVVRTRPVPAGLRIVQLQATAPGQRIDVQGDWLGSGARARTRVGVAVQTEDFGALLGGLGYGGQLDGGSGTATLDATWPGSPAGFSLLALDGTLELDARDGQLTEIEPGAGRVLGLLGIAQLPRRLTLDFSDFFERGFAFDRIHGSVRLAGARANTERITIAGPAAEITIRGGADLRAQTFDQVIEVVPRTGNLLTAVGAIAGGPMGAAIGAAANAVLRKPLGELSAKTYRVTGPWKDPEVEVVGRGPPAATAVAGPSPAG
ncbi:YhdP family protein [Cognatiluteimonas lumbrici]|uniref:YhdP family protein n=1 Tax=Cognatiluteimonas lumbrici TaxID=2559601 RepID=UPI001128490B|nr:YhdP family protein [Luteimonas lumbrici]